MDMTQRVALSKRLEAVEVELQAAVAGLDGSPASRTRLARARDAYREAEAQALEVINARAAAREERATYPPAAA
ncbi:hypothetical protein [Pyxidicoccus sp. MSG2]|uniref:hypothetical protein n=1 Tax=Pyxidicoccus sp. MSG2 TaxID=2996790 RepID=UPI00227042E7|nr:hypothetical protein [Pyxidicoccus sp. MSG2]MCY1018253.1 hypothetical protein [Pyxidicoccus sp. MSG2]